MSKGNEYPNSQASDLAESSDAKPTPDQQIELRRLEQKLNFKKRAIFIFAFAVVVAVGLIIVRYTTQAPAQETIVQSNSAQTELSQQQIEEYRQELKKALARYEVDIQPDINKMLLAKWESARVTELNLIKEKALTSFAQGAFWQAKQHYDDLLERSKTLIELYEKQTSNYVIAAKQAFDEGNMALSQITLNKALNLMPTNAQALELQARINAYSEVSALLSQLKIAKVENNLVKQIDILTEIVDLDPTRNDLSKDLEKVQEDYDVKRLEGLLNSAENAINNTDLEQAQSLLNSAKLIEPESKGLQRLQNQLNKQASERRLRQILTRLQTYSNKDNWQSVESLAKQTLQNYPNNEQVFDFLQRANQVLSASKRISQFAGREERLADNNIREAAKTAITNAFGASLNSPSLANQIKELSELIDKYEQEVAVTIKSDSDTYILVLGIGHVGQHVEKTISLKPGNYTLEGRREGYRNKRKDIVVKANKPLTVELVCDEPVFN